MGALESRSLHLFVKVIYIRNERDERIVHAGRDLVHMYSIMTESLEHLIFRLEEWVFEYAINTSYSPNEDHPPNTTFAIGVRSIFIPPMLENGRAESPEVAADLGHHWNEHRPDTTQLRHLMSHPEEQMLCLTGDWFASTYALQSLTLCCGPKLRRLPPHDGIAPQTGRGSSEKAAATPRSDSANYTAKGGIEAQTSRSDDVLPSGTSRPSSSSSSSSGRRDPLPPLRSSSSSPSFSSKRRVSFSPQIQPEEAIEELPPLDLPVSRRLSFRETQLQLRKEQGF